MSLPPSVRVFVAVEPVDMRGSFDALAGAVRRLGLDPVDGHLYLFLSRRKRLAKLLWFDGSGWCVLAKRLEAGTFQLPPLTGNETRVLVDGGMLASLLAGVDFTAKRRGWYRRAEGSPQIIQRTSASSAWARRILSYSRTSRTNHSSRMSGRQLYQ